MPPAVSDTPPYLPSSGVTACADAPPGKGIAIADAAALIRNSLCIDACPVAAVAVYPYHLALGPPRLRIGASGSGFRSRRGFTTDAGSSFASALLSGSRRGARG